MRAGEGGGRAHLQQRSLFLRGVNLVLLAQTHGSHALVPVPAHHKALVLKIVDLLRSQAHLATTGDPLALLHECSHRLSLSSQQMRSVSAHAKVSEKRYKRDTAQVGEAGEGRGHAPHVTHSRYEGNWPVLTVTVAFGGGGKLKRCFG